MEYLITLILIIIATYGVSKWNKAKFKDHLAYYKRVGGKPPPFKSGLEELWTRSWLVMLIAFIHTIISWNFGNGNLIDLPVSILFISGIFIVLFNRNVNDYLGKPKKEYTGKYGFIGEYFYRFTYVSTSNKKISDTIFKGKWWLQIAVWLGISLVGLIIGLFS